MPVNKHIEKQVLNGLLDLARETTGSDRGTALQLGVTAAAVTKWRSRGHIDGTNLIGLLRFVGFKEPYRAMECILVQ